MKIMKTLLLVNLLVFICIIGSSTARFLEVAEQTPIISPEITDSPQKSDENVVIEDKIEPSD